MNTKFKTLAIAAVLATTGFAAFSQGPGPMGGQGSAVGEGRMHRMSPEKMEARMAQRSTELKAKLKITPDQEGAWNTFTTAIKPTDKRMEQRPDRAEMAKLSTPERLDKMRALRNQQLAEMSAHMDKRDEATKTFYATLSAEQKKVFDSAYAPTGGRHGPATAK